MVFGNAPGLHHLRHRSHEPQVTERIWEGDPQRKPILSPLASSSTNVSHPSITMEITPLDVENPTLSEDLHLPFLPSILSSHRSTPTTPAEETRYRKRLLETGPVSSGQLVDWSGMTLTLLDSSSADQPEEPMEGALPSPNRQSQSTGSSTLGEGLADESNRLSLTLTAPSTPSFTTPLGSPTFTYSTRVAAKDASGTRRMMQKRKSSSLLRTSANYPIVENGTRQSQSNKST